MRTPRHWSCMPCRLSLLSGNCTLLSASRCNNIHIDYTHTHPWLMALRPGLPGRALTRQVKPIWILMKQETVSGSGISWAICKSAPRSRQITMPAPHHSVFLQAGCPFCRPTNSVKALMARHNIHIEYKAVKQFATCLTAMATHMPYRITQHYLPFGRGDIPACNLSRARNQFRTSEGCKTELT